MMKNMSKRKLMITIFLSVALIWAGSLGLAKLMLPDANPAQRHYGVILGDKADQILRQSCFDCHSNETRWPRYSSMPVVSVFVAHDVQEGREKLNFSEWNRMKKGKKQHAVQEALEEITDGEMPLAPYILMHPESRITAEKLTILKNSAASTLGISSDAYSKEKDQDD
jgi:hypothetical protein